MEPTTTPTDATSRYTEEEQRAILLEQCERGLRPDITEAQRAELASSVHQHVREWARSIEHVDAPTRDG